MRAARLHSSSRSTRTTELFKLFNLCNLITQINAPSLMPIYARSVELHNYTGLSIIVTNIALIK